MVSAPLTPVEKYNIPTKAVVADAADPATRDAGVAGILSATDRLDVGVLINNVGASHEMPVAFAETDPAEIDQIIQTVSWSMHP